MRTFATHEEAIAAGEQACRAVEATIGGGPVILLLPFILDGRLMMSCHVWVGDGGEHPVALQQMLAKQGLEALATWTLQSWSPTLGVVGDAAPSAELVGATVAMESMRNHAKGLVLIIHRKDGTGGAMAMIAEGDPEEFKTLAQRAPSFVKEWADKMMATIEPALAGRGDGAN